MSSRHLWWEPPAPTFWDHYPRRAGLEVLSIRRTREEKVLLVLKKGGDVSAFHNELYQAVGERAEISALVSKNACWRCGTRGHLSRSCKAPPRCLTCLDRGQNPRKGEGCPPDNDCQGH